MNDSSISSSRLPSLHRMRLWKSAQHGFVGLCSAGSCSGVQSSDDLCPSSENVKCCVDDGPSYIDGIDLADGRDVDVNSEAGLTSNTISCLAGANTAAKFVIARGWMATCRLDKNIVDTLASAAAQSWPADVYLFPAVWCGMSAKAQALQLISTLSSSTYGRIWIDIEAGAGWSSFNYAANLAWVVEATDAIATSVGGARVGILSSPAAWTTSMNGITDSRLNRYPLWYIGDSTQSFSDFTPFAGWTYPYAKRYSIGTTLCGPTVNQVWLPSRAAAGTTPVGEATGVSCASNGVAGTCQSVDACSNSAAVGACTDATKVCCLNAAPAQPAAAVIPPLTFTDGLCRNGAGICQPAVNCGATDTVFDNTPGCAADPDSYDVGVTGCVSQAPIAPPPSDAWLSVAGPPAYDPYKSARPFGVSKLAASTSTVNPASRVCVNKSVPKRECIMLADMHAHYTPCVRNYIKVPLNSNQFSALVSFVYNAGCGAIQGSLDTALNGGCYSCVKDQLAMWNKAGGKVLAGLTSRRAAEGALSTMMRSLRVSMDRVELAVRQMEDSHGRLYSTHQEG